MVTRGVHRVSWCVFFFLEPIRSAETLPAVRIGDDRCIVLRTQMDSWFFQVPQIEFPVFSAPEVWPQTEEAGCDS